MGKWIGAALAIAAIAAAVLFWPAQDTRSVSADGLKVIEGRGETATNPKTPDASVAAPASPPASVALPSPIPIAAADPEIAAMLGEEQPSFHDLHGRLRAEPRDRVWADREEVAIREALAEVPHLSGANAPKVTCAASLCQIYGSLPEAMGHDEINRAWGAVQDRPFMTRLTSRGLEHKGGMFSGRNGRSTMLLYYERKR